MTYRNNNNQQNGAAKNLRFTIKKNSLCIMNHNMEAQISKGYAAQNQIHIM